VRRERFEAGRQRPDHRMEPSRPTVCANHVPRRAAHSETLDGLKEARSCRIGPLALRY
jgi:hypothetical protein